MYPYDLNESLDRLASAKVLCVGAGGIGCELLKTLVLTGFRDIEVIDLDTIDTSNLNRQFLFRKRHVGQHKSEVAAQSVRAFCPQASILAHTGRIQETRFDGEFFKRFTVVLNGLDNVAARRHVNRMCLAAGVPLVESGTAGYVGQTSVHLKSLTQCYECVPKAAPKTFAVCTIRNTPEQPIHCVVWAKELLFSRLFGPPEEVNELDEVEAPKEGGEGGGEAPPPPPTSGYLMEEGEAPEEYAMRVFRRAFHHDVSRLLAMKEEWGGKNKPRPLVLEELLPHGLPPPTEAGGGSASRAVGLGGKGHHRVWSLAQNALVFLEAVRQFASQRKSDIGSLTFDKDDALAVDFVTAASNLRALQYGIPPQSLFECKGMAGNIIHAIATTNAIVSGLIVAEAVKIVRGELGLTRDGSLYPNHERMRLSCSKPPPPNKNCPVCNKAAMTLYVDTERATLRDIVFKVLKGRLNITQAAVDCERGAGLLYEEGEDVEEDLVEAYASNLSRPLASLPGGGLRHGSEITVMDEFQQFSARITIAHKDDFDEKEVPEGFLLTGATERPPPPAAEKAAAAAAGGAGGAGVAAEEEEEMCLVMDSDEEAAGVEVGGKRGREDGEGAGPSKRAKGGEEEEVEVMDD